MFSFHSLTNTTMKIFVTGATGFIGSHFLRCALASGHEVKAHRRSITSEPRIPIGASVHWVDCELNSIHECELSDCDALVHLAASGVTPQPANWDDCLNVNVCGSISLVRKAHDAGIKRIVVTGTYAEYGRSGLRYDFIPPDAPLEPTDIYSASKAACFQALAAWCRIEKTELYYGRVFSAYGEGQFEKNFWPALRSAARSGEDFSMTAGEQVRDFIQVEKVAETLLSACIEPLKAGEPKVVNIASGNPVTLRDFAADFWRQWGATGKLQLGVIPYRPDEVMRYVPLV